MCCVLPMFYFVLYCLSVWYYSVVTLRVIVWQVGVRWPHQVRGPKQRLQHSAPAVLPNLACVFCKMHAPVDLFHFCTDFPIIYQIMHKSNKTIYYHSCTVVFHEQQFIFSKYYELHSYTIFALQNPTSI